MDEAQVRRVLELVVEEVAGRLDAAMDADLGDRLREIARNMNVVVDQEEGPAMVRPVYDASVAIAAQALATAVEGRLMIEAGIADGAAGRG